MLRITGIYFLTQCSPYSHCQSSVHLAHSFRYSSRPRCYAACGLMVSSPEPCASSGGRLPEAFFLVFRLESQGAKAFLLVFRLESQGAKAQLSLAFSEQSALGTFSSLLPPGLAALLRSAGFFSGAVCFVRMTLARSAFLGFQIGFQRCKVM